MRFGIGKTLEWYQLLLVFTFIIVSKFKGKQETLTIQSIHQKPCLLQENRGMLEKPMISSQQSTFPCIALCSYRGGERHFTLALKNIHANKFSSCEVAQALPVWTFSVEVNAWLILLGPLLIWSFKKKQNKRKQYRYCSLIYTFLVITLQILEVYHHLIRLQYLQRKNSKLSLSSQVFLKSQAQKIPLFLRKQ